LRKEKKNKIEAKTKLKDQLIRFIPLVVAVVVIALAFKDLVPKLFAVVIFFLGALYGTKTKAVAEKMRMKSEGEKILAQIDKDKPEEK